MNRKEALKIGQNSVAVSQVKKGSYKIRVPYNPEYPLGVKMQAPWNYSYSEIRRLSAIEIAWVAAVSLGVSPQNFCVYDEISYCPGRARARLAAALNHKCSECKEYNEDDARCGGDR